MVDHEILKLEVSSIQRELIHMMLDGREDTLQFHKLYAVFQALAWAEDPLSFRKPSDALIVAPEGETRSVRSPRDILN